MNVASHAKKNVRYASNNIATPRGAAGQGSSTCAMNAITTGTAPPAKTSANTPKPPLSAESPLFSMKVLNPRTDRSARTKPRGRCTS